MVKIVELEPEQPMPPNVNVPVNENVPAATNEEDDSAPSLDRLHRWIEEGDGRLQRGLGWLSEHFGCSKWTTFWIVVVIYTVIMIRSPKLAGILSVLEEGYPMKGTLTSLAFEQWDDVCSWLLYWIILHGVGVFDILTGYCIWYYPLKTATMAYLHLPPLFGAQYLRRRWIDPIIYEGPEMVVVMKRSHPWLLDYLYKLDKDGIGKMQGEQLRDYVVKKRREFWTTIWSRSVAGSTQSSGGTTPTDGQSTNQASQSDIGQSTNPIGHGTNPIGPQPGQQQPEGQN